jgi:hypothetical protein
MASASINFPTFLFALTLMIWLEWFVRGELTATVVGTLLWFGLLR